MEPYTIEDKEYKEVCSSNILEVIAKGMVFQSPVVQSIVTLMSFLRGQLVKCSATLHPNTLIFSIVKMREAFALQKLLTFLQQKILAYFIY